MLPAMSAVVPPPAAAVSPAAAVEALVSAATASASAFVKPQVSDADLAPFAAFLSTVARPDRKEAEQQLLAQAFSLLNPTARDHPPVGAGWSQVQRERLREIQPVPQRAFKGRRWLTTSLKRFRPSFRLRLLTIAAAGK
jgi:hypothetical protein